MLPKRPFTHEHGVRPPEIHQQQVTGTMFDAYTHGMRCCGIVGDEDITVNAVEQTDQLTLSAHIHMIVQAPVVEKFHPHARGEVKRRVGAHESPGAQQPVRSHDRKMTPSRSFLQRMSVVATLSLAPGAIGTAHAATSARPTQPVQPAAEAPIDHATYDALLRAHVVNGFVDYAAFKASPAFARYLASLAAVSDARLSQLDDNARLAFWINVYNAYTIHLIIAHDERESIRNINKALGFLRLKGPWSDPFVHAGGQTLTLDEVEHRIIRDEFHEPRIHFALVCATMGSPPLRSEAFSGARLEEQLDDQARVFLRESPTRNRVDSSAAYLSPIFSAYRADFANSRAEFARFLAPYFDGAEQKMFESNKYRERQTVYDWALNSRERARRLKLLP